MHKPHFECSKVTCGNQSLRIKRFHHYGRFCAGCLVAQSCLILCNPMDCSSPGSPVYGILQAGHSSGLPCPPPGGLSNPGIEPGSPTLQIIYQLNYQGSPWKVLSAAVPLPEKPSHMCSRRNHKNLYSKIICNSKALRRASMVI